MVNERRWLSLIFALYFLFAVGYSLLMPIWEAPDEPAHYHLGWHLATYHEYPSEELNYETHQPRTYYYFASAVIRALDTIGPALTRFRHPREYPFTIRKPERRFDWTDENYVFIWGVYLLRWINILFGGIALWLNWKAYQQITSPPVALAALALMALMPQYLHIVSSVNNDVLGTMAGALLFYLALRFLIGRSMWLGPFLIVLAIPLPLLTKLSVLPVSAAVLVTSAWNWFLGFSQKRWLLYSGVLILLGAGFFYLLFPENVQSALNEIQWRLFSLRKDALTEKYLRAITSQIVWTYWGKVGWLAVGLPLSAIQLLTGLAMIGMTLQAVHLIRSGTGGLVLALWLTVWAISIFTLLAVFRNGLTTFATQGRLLFPAVGALSILIAAGWHTILAPRLQGYLPLFVVLFFLFCNLLLWLTGIIPIYYQPFFD